MVRESLSKAQTRVNFRGHAWPHGDTKPPILEDGAAISAAAAAAAAAASYAYFTLPLYL